MSRPVRLRSGQHLRSTWQNHSINKKHNVLPFVISSGVEKSLIIRIMGRDYSFWIYIVTNRNHSVLYVGVTNSLSRRAWQHREGTGASFAAAYRCTKLIYYEHYRNARDAIARETQLKKWSREEG
jgi:putative endonuclease